MGILDSIFGGGSQESKVELPDYIKNPAHSMGSFTNEIFDREKKAYKNTGGFNPIQQEALNSIIGTARQGNALNQPATDYIAGIFRNQGLNQGQAGLANNLMGGATNPAFNAFRDYADSKEIGRNPAMGGYGHLAAFGGADNVGVQGGLHGYQDFARTGGVDPSAAGWADMARTGGGTNPGMAGYQNFARTGGGPNAAMGGTMAVAGGAFQNMNPAMRETARLAMGGDVGTNPFLEGTFNRAADVAGQNFKENVIGGMDRGHAAQGRLGSNAYANARNRAEESYGRGINDLAQQVFGGAYESDQGRRMGALGQLGQMGQFDQSMRMGALNQAGQYSAQQMQNQLAGIGGQSQLGQQQVQNRLAGLSGQQQSAGMANQNRLAGIAGQNQIGQQTIGNQLGALQGQAQLGEADLGRRFSALENIGALGQQDVQNRLAGAGLWNQGTQNVYGALGSMPALNQARYGDLDRLFSAGQTQMEAPYQQLMTAGRALQMLPYGQSTTQTQSMNPFSQMIGLGTAAAGAYAPFYMANAMGGAGAASAMSDRRLKRDIERVGATPGGTPLYRFKYLWSDDEHVGVMADEAPPEAVTIALADVAMVDYAKVH
jgi:hypothetical protein